MKQTAGDIVLLQDRRLQGGGGGGRQAANSRIEIRAPPPPLPYWTGPGFTLQKRLSGKIADLSRQHPESVKKGNCGGRERSADGTNGHDAVPSSRPVPAKSKTAIILR